jgi:hypothetical protein
MIDRSRKNRMCKQQKLTPEQVRAIRKSNKRIAIWRGNMLSTPASSNSKARQLGMA